MRATKSQSAMEYLMTYGWAILIIAVVLAVLFQLGVFNGSNFGNAATAGSCEVQKTSAGSSLVGECQGLVPKFVASFNGAGKVTVTSVSSEPTGSQSRTLTGWIYFTGQPTGGYAMASYGASSTYNAFYPFVRPTSQFLVTTFGSDLLVSNGGAVPGTWEFVAEAYNGVAEIGYLGISGSVTSASQATTATTPQSSFYIGANPTGGNLFVGDIANVQLYNTTLSSAEVTALYQEGIGGAPVNPNYIVGWWPLNGNANDYSGNNNNGAVSGVGFSSLWQSGYTAP